MNVRPEVWALAGCQGILTGSQEDTLTGGQGCTDWKSGGIESISHNGCGVLVRMEVRVGRIRVRTGLVRFKWVKARTVRVSKKHR